MAKEKSLLIQQLEEVARYMQILDENPFKIRAFEKGAQALSAADARLSEIASGKVKVPGVGEGLRGAIKEFLETGEVAALSELSKKVPAAVLELMRIPGLGPKKAITIHEELGIQSISELEYACRENRLVTLKGFGEALQTKVLRAIEELASRAGKMRLDEALKLADELEAGLSKVLAKTFKTKPHVKRVGEMGRRHEIVETLEWAISPLVVSEKEAKALLDWESGPLLDSIKARQMISGTVKGGLNAKLWVFAKALEERELFALCAPQELREEAKAHEGWEPTWLEAEWLAGTQKPSPKPSQDTYRRSRDGSVRGVFHCHTTESDGAATLEEMVEAAEARGYEYIGISDHSQSAFYARGLKSEQLETQRERIAKLQKKVSIKIFHGVESDILADGALDYPKDVLEEFDFVVGSIHSRFQMDKAAMTERVARALANPFLTMWGHPTGRLILGRKGYELDWNVCLKTAAESGAAIEINANPQRLDVDWRLGPELRRHGVSLFVNPDAHSTEGLADTEYGEYVAEKAMLSRESILNLMPVNEMEKYLWERKKRRATKKRA